MKKPAGLALLMLIAACAPVPQAAPEPAAPPPTAPPPSAPVPAPAPLSGDWTDWPAASGNWTYRAEPGGSSVASFGASGAAPQFSVRCDHAARRILLLHPGVLPSGKSAMMTITATAGSARYPVANVAGGLPYVVATLAPRDAMLDKVIFSRGRFLVNVEGGSDLVVPSWPEIARVVEDCRS